MQLQQQTLQKREHKEPIRCMMSQVRLNLDKCDKWCARHCVTVAMARAIIHGMEQVAHYFPLTASASTIRCLNMLQHASNTSLNPGVQTYIPILQMNDHQN